MSDDTQDNNAVDLATELTIAWLGNPNTRISAEEVPAFLGKMHETVSALLGSGTAAPAAEPASVEPAFGQELDRTASGSKSGSIRVLRVDAASSVLE